MSDYFVEHSLSPTRTIGEGDVFSVFSVTTWSIRTADDIRYSVRVVLRSMAAHAFEKGECGNACTNREWGLCVKDRGHRGFCADYYGRTWDARRRRGESKPVPTVDTSAAPGAAKP